MRLPVAASSRQTICSYGIGVMYYEFAKPDVYCNGHLNGSDSWLKYIHLFPSEDEVSLGIPSADFLNSSRTCLSEHVNINKLYMYI